MILSGTLAHFGLPLEGVAVILGVDALMDMGRTTINLVGNCLATVVMAAGRANSAPSGSRGTGAGRSARAYRHLKSYSRWDKPRGQRTYKRKAMRSP